MISYFWSLPKAHNHSWVWEQGFAFQLSSLFTTMVQCSAHITVDAYWAVHHLFISHSISLSHVEKIPRYLISLPPWREQPTIFQQGTMASDLELLTLIPASSHHPSACWRSWSDKANRTKSSAKNRNALQRFTNCTLSSDGCTLIS